MSDMEIVERAQPARRLCGRFGLAIATAVLTVFGPAAAGVAASTPVPFQKSKSFNCTGNPCTVGFGKVGKNRRLHINHVSCWIRATGAAEMKDAGLYAGKRRYDAFVPVRLSGALAEEKYAFNQQTTFFAKAGERVSIRVENVGALAFEMLECKIAGEIEALD